MHWVRNVDLDTASVWIQRRQTNPVITPEVCELHIRREKGQGTPSAIKRRIRLHYLFLFVCLFVCLFL
jgi:hypothetical protein